MSLLFQKAQRGKQSTSRRFRVSPYATTHSDGDAPSPMLSASKSMSSRTLVRKTKQMREQYLQTAQGYSKDQQADLQALRQEVGLDGTSDSLDALGASTTDQEWDEDGWVDEPDDQFCSLSAAIARQLGVDTTAQTWTERRARERLSWAAEIDKICDALMEFKRCGPPSPPDVENSSSTGGFSILCVHLTDKRIRPFISTSAEVSKAVTLARHGYIPPTPSSPSYAIHIDVLKYCAALRRHASAISLQSITSAICEVHNIVYERHLRTQLSGAYDIYLEVTRMIDSRLAKVLARDDLDWRMANACAACTYRLQDEPELKFSILATCDGNDSLKRAANASLADQRVLKHSYFLDSDYVDRFENEVARRSKSKGVNRDKAAVTTHDSGAGQLAASHDQSSNGPALASEAPGQDPEGTTDGVSSHDTGNCESQTLACEDRWKNARADDAGKQVIVFDETGIFAVSCRHGFVLLVEDMRNSGELSKYGLAAVNKLCRVFGDRVLVGYDIGCTFRGTAQRSPLVGPLVRKHQLDFVVGSFHGYAHNRKCQLKNHPLNVVGAGLESFEQNEQLFSSTNAVALTTRNASRFHRTQHIVLRLSGWDMDRRCHLGSTIRSKYKSAVHVLTTLPNEINQLCPGKNDDHWQAMFRAECNYFAALQSPSPESSFAMLYVKRLRVLAEKRKAYDDAFSVTIAYTLPAQIDNYRKHPTIQNTDREHEYHHSFAAQTRKMEARRTAATEQLLAVQTEVARMEEEHGISPRWAPGCPEWEAAEKREANEDFYHALRDLESLVVQRIAELGKAHCAGTGYKARVHIAKGIKRREKAIHNALQQYNAAARTLDPPRPTLSFKDLGDYAYHANFDFLKYSEHGAQEAEWSNPVTRHCVAAWQKIQRAKEEITRLNIEIRRVCTHIKDDELFLLQQYNALRNSDPDLAFELHKRIELAVRINRRIQHDLAVIAELPGFTGDLTCGTRLGPSSADDGPSTSVTTPTGDMLSNILSEMVLEEPLVTTTGEEDGEEGLSDGEENRLNVIGDKCNVM